jgi:hypothetical protein
MIKLIAIILTTICIASTGDVVAQPSGFTKIDVKSRVQIEVPEHWTINDADNRARVRDLAQKIIGVEISHVAALSVSSFPTPSNMWVRVSLVPLTPPITQADLTRELRNGEKKFLKEVREEWDEEAPVMWAGLKKLGVTEVGQPSFKIEKLGGKFAIAIRYGRTSIGDASRAIKVAQYHVLLGDQKALITLSYIDGIPEIMVVHDRIKNSISIR